MRSINVAMPICTWLANHERVGRLNALTTLMFLGCSGEIGSSLPHANTTLTGTFPSGADTANAQGDVVAALSTGASDTTSQVTSGADGATMEGDLTMPSAGASVSAPASASGGGAGVVDASYRPNLDGEPIRARLVRLTHSQWENSVRDLLQLDEPSGLSDGFEGDPPRGTFDNNERALEVTSTLWGDYQRAAEALAEAATNDDARRSAILAGASSAEDFVRDFGARVFRRPLSAAEQTAYVAAYAGASQFFPELDAARAGFRLVIEAMLQSPNFIYRSELGDDGARLDSFETASKLSFLLRDTTPDAELLEAARASSLASGAQLESWAERMIEEDGMRTVVANYHRTLFGTRRFESIVKDRAAFPDFDPASGPDFRAETELFISHVFERDQGVHELLTSTTGFVNANTAPLYSVSAPTGAAFFEVDLGPERPGLFTRIGFLAYNGTNTQPDPIHRGVDLNQRLLCVNLVAPPGELPQLPPFEPNQTNRQRVVAATEEDGTQCAGCHGLLINPLGFAFENYDALGQLRTRDNGQPIDTSGTYQFATGARGFGGAAELSALLAQDPQVHGCYARNVAEFTLGRDLDEGDQSLVGELMDRSLASASIKELILTVVASDAFLARTGAAR